MKKIILAIVLLGAVGIVAFRAARSDLSYSSDLSDRSAISPKAKTNSAATTASPTGKMAIVAPAPIAPTALIAPKSPIAKAPPAVAAAATTPQSASPNPRAELATIIPELARLMDTQDFETLMQDFMPPDELDAMLADVGQPGQPMALTDLANRMRQNPVTVQKMAGAAQFMSYLQTLTPTMDETGQKASYRMPMTINGKTTVDFIKIDGNWYVQDGRQYFK